MSVPILSVEDDGIRLEVVDPQGSGRRSEVVLDQLVQDERAIRLEETIYRVPHASFDLLEDEEKAALGIPTPSNILGRLVTSRGGNGERRLSLDLRSANGEVLNGLKRKGPFLVRDSGEAMLLDARLRRLDEHLTDPGFSQLRRGDHEQSYFAQAKVLANMAEVELEPWLEREEYVVPDGLGMDLRGDLVDGIELRPVARGVDDPSLQEAVRATRGKRAVVWKADGRHRRRVLLDSKHRRALKTLDERGRHVAPEDVPRLLDDPEQFVPEGFDLSDFSERVKGLRLRVYDSSPYVSVRQEKLQWFPSVDVRLSRESDLAGDEPNEGEIDVTPQEFMEKARQAAREGRTHFLHDGAAVRFDPKELGGLEQLEEVAGPGFNKPVNRAQRYVLDIFENLKALEFSTGDAGSEAESREIQEYPLPSDLQATLHPFQRDGYCWLRTNECKRRGALLADDMGLGKTLQAIAFLLARSGDDDWGPSLIVLPKTLQQNWYEEVQRFAPRLRMGRYAGGPIDDVHVFDDFDLVATTYDTLRINQMALARVDWKVVICDEAQAIKNPTTGRTTAVKGLKAAMRIAITGTPVENGLTELWSIMDWVQPGLLRSRAEFRQVYERPIVAAKTEDERARPIRALQDRMLDYYMRRLKSEVLEGLPSKTTHRCEAPLSSFQLRQYASRVEEARRGGRGAMLACLQGLLRLCACPWDDEDAYSLAATPETLEQCPKLGVLVETLDAIRDGDEKVLIFAERIAVQAMLQSVVRQRYGIRADIVNGQMKDGRQAVVRRFNESDGFNVLILSPKVGGTGLNITAANHVVHYMRMWNPAVENQATDRVYRIGQTSDVHVYLPIVVWPDEDAQSVEEVLDQLLTDKSGLATNVIVPTMHKVSEEEVMRGVFQSGGDG